MDRDRFVGQSVEVHGSLVPWPTLQTVNSPLGFPFITEDYPDPMHVRPYELRDRREYQRMREALWPDCTDADNDIWFARDDAATFLAERPDGTLCGFVEVGARSIADGCLTSPVGYIEGWYVEPDMRRRGVGRALLMAAEDWSLARGYSEIASDALLENHVSHAAHGRCGYEEVCRVVQFRKSLI